MVDLFALGGSVAGFNRYPAWLHRLGHLAHQVDLQKPVLERGALRLDVVGQGASSALPEELPSRNALVQAFTRLVQMVDRTETPIAAISTRRTEGAKAQ